MFFSFFIFVEFLEFCFMFLISGGSPADARCFCDPRGRRSVQRNRSVSK